MTITASPLTVSRRNAAVSASAWFHTTDPGVFVCTYPTGITGPATVEAAGSRAYVANNQRNDDGFNVPAAGATAIAGRDGVTIGFVFDPSSHQNHPDNFADLVNIAYNYSISRRVNWMIQTSKSASAAVYYVRFLQSNTVAGNDALTLLNSPLYMSDGVRKIILTLSGTSVKMYVDNNTLLRDDARVAPDGTISDPYCKIQSCEGLTYWASVLSAGDIAAWMAGSATGAAPVVDYSLLEETGTARDFSANAYDGVFDLDANYPASQIARTYIDTGFTSPLVEVPITIAADCTAGVKNITLRRTRVGIPARTPALSDAVVYDDGTIPVTVAVTAEAVTIGPDVDCQVPSYPATFDLQLTGNYDGAATIVSDDASLVPTSPVTISGGVAVVACTVSADVTGATVTATGPGGDTDACTVTVSEVPEEITPLKIGPSQTLRSGVTSIYLHITGDDGACTVTASPVVGLSGVPATVTIASGEADLTLTKMSAGTYTITATQGALSDTCTIVVPVGFTAATEYDLVQDIADMIETYGVGYHYDPELLTDTGGDLEDRMFTVRETDVTNGPFVNGKTVTLAVDAYYCNRAPSSDAKALIDYLNCEADAPSYVHALFATGGIVTEEQGAQKITYEIQVSLG